jgi:NTP pyrophosphatase (non-canonical NTP hydrolase)
MTKGTFQHDVHAWMLRCFGEEVAGDERDRSHRFIEEALELVQATGATKNECLQLVDYVYSRPVGNRSQEVGGVAVTLAALCTAAGINLEEAQGIELARVWKKIDAIRAKHRSKPALSPLPGKAVTP